MRNQQKMHTVGVCQKEEAYGWFWLCFFYEKQKYADQYTKKVQQTVIDFANHTDGVIKEIIEQFCLK